MSGPTHSQCVYFRNGLCTLRGIQVPPNEPACPNFMPKAPQAQPQAPPPIPIYGQPLPPPRVMQRVRRRLMRRRRRGWGWRS
ncbi:MAG TPA: hypothetical protein ENF79_03115 [Nitrososphaeria archaeon]|nr:hypothetical protein [Nitrososphaeria archaeon]